MRSVDAARADVALSLGGVSVMGTAAAAGACDDALLSLKPQYTALAATSPQSTNVPPATAHLLPGLLTMPGIIIEPNPYPRPS